MLTNKISVREKNQTFFFWSCCILPEVTKNHPSEDLYREGPASCLDLTKPDPPRNGTTRLLRKGAHCTALTRKYPKVMTAVRRSSKAQSWNKVERISQRTQL
ncbi:hypothetical protein PR202_gb24921 [Eleusine coracana subsp. coracana]|uniref:Uncharacterized protein n=1 Tax=Eleusine coracana subsp. coracana TaxID=191504 RepID=A0AAV5FNN8_ELECO|nr:hypothetical protein PR202_gb24921 [Eleusine coracana subsp. coracana]